jgi:hypothetical protein
MGNVKKYAPTLGPGSNAIADKGAKTSHGSIRMTQRKNKPV